MFSYNYFLIQSLYQSTNKSTAVIWCVGDKSCILYMTSIGQFSYSKDPRSGGFLFIHRCTMVNELQLCIIQVYQYKKTIW